MDLSKLKRPPIDVVGKMFIIFTSALPSTSWKEEKKGPCSAVSGLPQKLNLLIPTLAHGRFAAAAHAVIISHLRSSLKYREVSKLNTLSQTA
ncbi:hypothetical protein TNCV_1479101 [Trichonephila clavipes]|nr:hypothetical protein TNCV_1479101 [Trichonephila clavipes]